MEVPKDEGFRINRDKIQSVDKVDLDSELQSLDLAVYDQTTLEQGIIAQVDEALGKSGVNDSIEDGEIIDEEDACKVPDVETNHEPCTSLASQRSNKTPDNTSILERYLKSQAELATKIGSKRTKPDSKKREASSDFQTSPNKVAKLEVSVSPKKRFRIKPNEKDEDRKSNVVLRDHEEPTAPVEPVIESVKKVASKRPLKGTSNLLSSPDSESCCESDWDSSEDEVPLKKRKKVLDDGDVEMFARRVKHIPDHDEHIDLGNDFKCPSAIWNGLFHYQQEGLRWLTKLHEDQHGGILGDEMGLGKTIQIISFFAVLHYSSLKDSATSTTGLGPSLIVCPTTVMHQWVREFHKWFPRLRVAILHESGTFKGKKRSHLIKSICRSGGVLITSYSGLVNNKDTIVNKSWQYVVLDEGHKIRNVEAQVTKVAKEFGTPHRLILSGSPLQNNLKELWSLIDFVYPGKLNSLETFMNTLANPIVHGGYANASKAQVMAAFKCATIIKDTIKPLLLRRTKAEVDIELPEKKEQILFCRLTEEQRSFYRSYVDKLDFRDLISKKSVLFQSLHILRKICNHPDLFSYDSSSCSYFGDPNAEQFGYWKRAAKMVVIETLLKLWFKQGHRVLLFCQTKKMLNIIEDFVKRNNYKYLRLDGGTSIAARQPLIDKFNNDSSFFIMVLTTKVGGLGVNLTGANRVIIYDPDWNPATDTQARERAWRIGQTRDVTIYRLITAGTIEEKIYHRQIYKQFLSNKVLKDPKQRRFFKSNDLNELFTLNETVQGGTNETAAIFAGTGSEVKLDLNKTKLSPRAACTEITFSESKIEEMKRKAQELSKKFALVCGKKDEALKKELIYGPDGQLIYKTETLKTSNNNNNSTINNNSNERAAQSSSPSKIRKERKKDENQPSGLFQDHKKKYGHSSLEIDGTCVPNLVKLKKLKKNKEAKKAYELSANQDDYVLHKLFSKSGVETALKHDTIVEGGPSDFAIVEEEANKLAAEAIKAFKTAPRPPQTAAVIRPFLRALKINGASSADIISACNRRNLTGDVSPQVADLLKDIISWLVSQGGRASTNQLVDEFDKKVTIGRSPLFKSLLQTVATFKRGPDQVGYWTIKEDFK